MADHSPRIAVCAEPGCHESFTTRSNHRIVRCAKHRALHIKAANRKWAEENSHKEIGCIDTPSTWTGERIWEVVVPADCPWAFPRGAVFSQEEKNAMLLEGAFDVGMVIERHGVRMAVVEDGCKQRLVRV